MVEEGRSQEIFGTLIEAAPNAMLVLGEQAEIAIVNGRTEILFGYARHELLGQHVEMLLPDLERHIQEADQAHGDLELSGIRNGGRSFPAEISFSSISAGGRELIACVVRDATQRRRVESKLRFLADHDALTGLGNRRQFERHVAEQIARARRYGESAALLLIDVDEFKRINDTYGHRVGDDALRLIGHLFQQSIRSTDSVARIGGDEFAVLLPHTDRRAAEEVADKLHHSVTECTLSAGGRGDVPLSLSIGISEIDRHTAGAETAFRAADRAMYEQKQGSPTPRG
jgi:diguanylate cyclase (GGDEF)-like protein/PAS domain S-box-containing protein